jgi:hypothetical protein
MMDRSHGPACALLGVLVACAARDIGDSVGDDGDSSTDESSGGGVDESSEGGTVEKQCDAPGASRACDAGVEYCDFIAGAYRWGECLADVECKPGETRDCGGSMGFEQRCDLWNGVPQWNAGDCMTPLVLAFDARLPEYEPASAAAFDLAGGDACLSTDWPSARTPWLVLDRDHDGAIADGRELFGSGTLLATGRRARDGFEALAELDTDRDHAVTPRDRHWLELVVWRDVDGDRRSDASELEPLAAQGIVALELSSIPGWECDPRGNCAGPRSAMRTASGEHGHVIDVYLACQ